MDYEKEYKDAMERAKKWGLTHKLCIEDIFPELAESEDERIRKKLVEYHSQQFEKNRDQEVGLFHKDAIAYLEKQKEPQHAIRVTKGFGDPDGPRFEFVDLQKEQNPAEYGDEFITEAEEYASKINCGEYKVEVTEAYIAGALRANNKPAEWSEEDEEHRKSILARLDGMCKKGATFTRTRFAISEDEDWLRSLRPSWKPSEEQMEELNKVRTLNPGLDTLYQQLKNM